jgi:hypothetical protein
VLARPTPASGRLLAASCISPVTVLLSIERGFIRFRTYVEDVFTTP